MATTADLAHTLHLPRQEVRRIIDRYRVTDGKGFRLKDFDPSDTTGHLLSHEEANALLTESVQRLSERQEKLYAQDRWAMLCVLQAMDAAGKDGTIKHVMSGVNPQGVQVTSFKAPGPSRSRMTSSGAPIWRCPLGGILAYSTAATTRRCWWCACIPNCWTSSMCRGS